MKRGLIFMLVAMMFGMATGFVACDNGTTSNGGEEIWRETAEFLHGKWMKANSPNRGAIITIVAGSRADEVIITTPSTLCHLKELYSHRV